MAFIQQENFSFSNPSQNTILNLPDLDLHSWSSQNDVKLNKEENEGNKQEMVSFSRYKKEDPHELSLRDIVVEFPTILSYMKENYTQETEKRGLESFDGRIKVRESKKSKSKWLLLKLLFPLPSKVERKKKDGRISNNSLILSPKLSIEKRENATKLSIEKRENNQNKFFDDFDLWEDNLFSDTSRSSSSSSTSSNISHECDEKYGYNRRKMKSGCFPFN